MHAQRIQQIHILFLSLAILESKIKGFSVLRLPNPSFALSAYEHTLIVNAGKEFLPPETTIFHDIDGALVALFIPQGMTITINEGIKVK